MLPQRPGDLLHGFDAGTHGLPEQKLRTPNTPPNHPEQNDRTAHQEVVGRRPVNSPRNRLPLFRRPDLGSATSRAIACAAQAVAAVEIHWSCPNGNPLSK